MDELAAAAAVVAMTVHGFADQEFGQRECAGSRGDADWPAPGALSMAEGDANDAAHAAAEQLGDAASKVPNATRVPRDTPCVQHLARADSTL